MSNLRRIGNQISVPIRADEAGYLGRECPACEGYFKVTPGTGITTGDPPCHCPYCGHEGSPNSFWTKAQIEYAHSVAFNKLTGAVLADLKQLEFDTKPREMFGVGMSVRVEGRPHPIRYYRESRLETEVGCDHCTLRYAIYGVFAYCPDCGRHNSRQILEKNLELASKQLELAATVVGELSEHLVADALENVVSAFDGFAREAARVRAAESSNPARAQEMSFQNLSGARKNVQDLFGFDLATALDAAEWDMTCRCFQKRHLLAHSMGVVDEAYLRKTNDPDAKLGRKISIDPQEVGRLVDAVVKLGRHLDESLARRPGS